jgi:hypothetical protein
MKKERKILTAVRLEPEVKKALDSLSEMEGSSNAELIRAAIELFCLLTYFEAREDNEELPAEFIGYIENTVLRQHFSKLSKTMLYRKQQEHSKNNGEWTGGNPDEKRGER